MGNNFNSRARIEHVGCFLLGRERDKISTHAPHEECDRFPFQKGHTLRYFNTRTHMECDEPANHLQNHRSYFNSRTHIECDTSIAPPLVAEQIFQFTHPQRVRRAFALWYVVIFLHFNSRTHEECDRHQVVIPWFIHCFNTRTHEECDWKIRKS